MTEPDLIETLQNTLKNVGEKAQKRLDRDRGTRITLQERVKTKKGREITVTVNGFDSTLVMGDLNHAVQEVKKKL